MNMYNEAIECWALVEKMTHGNSIDSFEIETE